MIRKFKRLRDFEIALQIKREDFIMPPREAQRHWLLNRAVREFADNLQALDGIAKTLVPGRDELIRHELDEVLGDDLAIMEDWQLPLMKAMAEAATEHHGDVLEVGFGRGVSASYIQELGVRSHTIIECNASVIARFEDWKRHHPDKHIQLIEGMWQDVGDQLTSYDGIFFHTYPMTEAEHLESLSAETFAEAFFPVAAKHLRSGGVFTYLSNEIDSFSRTHQRLLFRYFSEINLARISLDVPEDVKDAWWADTMISVKVRK